MSAREPRPEMASLQNIIMSQKSQFFASQGQANGITLDAFNNAFQNLGGIIQNLQDQLGAEKSTVKILEQKIKELEAKLQPAK